MAEALAALATVKGKRGYVMAILLSPLLIWIAIAIYPRYWLLFLLVLGGGAAIVSAMHAGDRHGIVFLFVAYGLGPVSLLVGAIIVAVRKAIRARARGRPVEDAFE